MEGVQTKSWTYDVPDWSLHTQQGLACILHFSAFKDWLFCTFPHLSSFVPKEAFGDAIIDVGRHPKSVFARQIRNSGLRATEYPLASVARSPLLREIALETQTKALKRRPMSLFARLRRGGEGQARGKGARGHAPCSNNPRAGGQPTGLSVRCKNCARDTPPRPRFPVCFLDGALLAAGEEKPGEGGGDEGGACSREGDGAGAAGQGHRPLLVVGHGVGLRGAVVFEGRRQVA